MSPGSLGSALEAPFRRNPLTGPVLTGMDGVVSPGSLGSALEAPFRRNPLTGPAYPKGARNVAAQVRFDSHAPIALRQSIEQALR